MERLLRAVKAPLKWGRSAFIRALHPARRRRAQESLREGAPIRSVLFLCLGNVCRSPYAEHALRATLERRAMNGISVDSAGFIGPGRPAPGEALRDARSRGLDLSAHVSKLVTSELTAAHELVVVMEPAQAVAVRRQFGARTRTLVLGDLDPLRPGRRAILDPWGRTPEEFRDSFDRIDRCLALLLPFLEEGA